MLKPFAAAMAVFTFAASAAAGEPAPAPLAPMPELAVPLPAAPAAPGAAANKSANKTDAPLPAIDDDDAPPAPAAPAEKPGAGAAADENGGSDAKEAGATDGADATAAALRQLLDRPGLEPAARAALRDALARLRRQEAQRALAGDKGRLAEELRGELERARAAEPNNRALGLVLVRYLAFLDDYPAARDLMEKLRPASAADVAWPLGMADISLQLGDERRALAYASQTVSLLQAGAGFALSAPVAATEVSGYRLYARDPRAAFAPGSDLLLYVEIDGARLQTRGNAWECQLDFGLELLDSAGGVCDKNLEYGRYEQAYAGRVREIHASVNYRVPDGLKAGRYTLRLYCRDRVADVAAHADFAFTVAGGAGAGEPRRDLKQERKVDADLYKRALEGVDPLAPVPGMDPLDILQSIDGLEGQGGKKPGAAANDENLKKKYRLQGLNISRERSKMQGGLFTQP